MARRIGQIVVDLGFLTDEQLEIVLEEQEQNTYGGATSETEGVSEDAE